VSTTRPSGYDERHSTQLEANRRGAHRARPNPVLSLLPFLTVAIVVFGVIGGAWAVLGGNDLFNRDSPSGTLVGASPLQSTTPTAQPTQSTTAPAQITPSETTPAETTPAETTTAPSPTVDRDAELVVLNSTSTQGLGKRVAAKLIDDGWKVPATPKNYVGSSSTTVYYAKKSQQATATAVAKSLGGYANDRDADLAADGITVIIGDDYKE
jgi:hypothetical protein